MSFLRLIEATPVGRFGARGLLALRAYNRHVLTRFPRAWVLRLHVVLLLAPPALLASCLWALLIPVSARAAPSPLSLLSGLLGASALVSIAWGYAVLRDRRNSYFTREIDNPFLLIEAFIGLIAINGIPFVAAGFLEARVAQLVTRDEIVDDIVWLKIAKVMISKSGVYDLKHSDSRMGILEGHLYPVVDDYDNCDEHYYYAQKLFYIERRLVSSFQDLL